MFILSSRPVPDSGLFRPVSNAGYRTETGRKSRLPTLREGPLAGAPPDADLGGAPAPAAPAADEPRDNLITKRPRRIVQPVRRHVLHPQHYAVTAGALEGGVVAGFHSGRHSARVALGELLALKAPDS